MYLAARLNRLRKNLAWTQNATSEGKARADFEALRGAEEPLFHGTARICEFFRKV
jgi:hypothetical protein